MTHNILLVDDHAIVRAGLRRLLSTLAPCEIVEAATGRDALAALQQHLVDLVILDLNLPGLGGVELLRRMLQDEPALRVLVLTMHAEPLYAQRALDAGARGYISKNVTPEEMLLAVRRVASGGRYVEAEIAQELALSVGRHPMQQLSERELEVMRLLAHGHSLQQIADTLGIAYKTAANLCTQTKTKLGVGRTADLIRMAIQLRINA